MHMLAIIYCLCEPMSPESRVRSSQSWEPSAMLHTARASVRLSPRGTVVLTELAEAIKGLICVLPWLWGP